MNKKGVGYLPCHYVDGLPGPLQALVLADETVRIKAPPDRNDELRSSDDVANLLRRPAAGAEIVCEPCHERLTCRQSHFDLVLPLLSGFDVVVRDERIDPLPDQ